MSTPLQTFSDSEIDLRWQQSFLSKGINDKLRVSTDGVYRGFRLATNVAALTVTLKADEKFTDHLATAFSASGEAVTIHRTGGDFSQSLAAFVSKTVVLCLVNSYALGKATRATIQAFELSPSDEFTGAGDHVVPLGVVVVPAAGVIPAANITARFRREPWERRGSGEVAWSPLLQNGGFERSTNNLSSQADSQAAQSWFAGDNDAFYFIVDETNVNTGFRSMLLQAPAAATMTSGFLRQFLNSPVKPKRFVRLELWIKQLKVITAGTLHFSLEFVDKATTPTIVSSINVPLTGIDGAFRKFTDAIEVPTGAVLLRKVDLTFTGIAVGSGGSVLNVDDVQVWAEPTEREQPFSFADAWAREMSASVMRVLDPAGDLNQDAAQLRMESSNADEGILHLEQIRDTLNVNSYPPALSPQGRVTNIAHGLVGSDGDASLARLDAKYRATGATAFTLMFESLPDTSGRAIRMYVSANGRLMFTVNATFDGTGNWSKDTDGEISTRWVQVNSIIELQMRAAGAGTWADGGWTTVFSVNSAGALVATSSATADKFLATSAAVGNAANDGDEVARFQNLDNTVNVDPASAATVPVLFRLGSANQDGWDFYAWRRANDDPAFAIHAVVNGALDARILNLFKDEIKTAVLVTMNNTLQLNGTMVVFAGTVDMHGAVNPLKDTAVTDKLTRKSFTKASGLIDFELATYTYIDGKNVVDSLTEVDMGGGIKGLQITFAQPMLNDKYRVVFGTEGGLGFVPTVNLATKDENGFVIEIWLASDSNPHGVNLISNTKISFQVEGDM